MRAYVSSLGCKLNQVEIDTLASELAGAGHEIVSSPSDADLCVLNTCAVTHVASQKSRQTLRRLHRENPDARLVVTGCYAELSPDELSGLPGVEFVAGNQQKERLAELLGGSAGQATGEAISYHQPRTRALVKIQDGCDNACAYCIIHVARGPQRSRSPEHILDEVRARLDEGHLEIVLTGVHIGAYGRDAGGGAGNRDLWSLVAGILAETKVPRLRLSSIEPWDLDARALALWDDPRLCRHLHLPLQSGCDATLARMARHYTTAQFAALVTEARNAIPDLAVTTDIIVGFPGETEEEFAAGLAFVEAMRFSRAHVFPFSLRPGTAAARMPAQVPPQVKRERARAMQTITAASNQTFRQRFLGRAMNVLWESSRERDQGRTWSGLTGNYLRVHTTTDADLANSMRRTRLLELSGRGLWGEILD